VQTPEMFLSGVFYVHKAKISRGYKEKPTKFTFVENETLKQSSPRVTLDWKII